MGGGGHAMGGGGESEGGGGGAGIGEMCSASWLRGGVVGIGVR